MVEPPLCAQVLSSELVGRILHSEMLTSSDDPDQMFDSVT